MVAVVVDGIAGTLRPQEAMEGVECIIGKFVVFFSGSRIKKNAFYAFHDLLVCD
jgi:hypothetical protein